jgi:hypothetical protein
MFLMASVLVVLVCGNGNIAIIVVLSLSSSLLCPSHPVDAVVVTVVNPLPSLQKYIVMFLMVWVLVVLLVCGNSSIIIVVVLFSSLSSLCPSHPINIIV